MFGTNQIVGQKFFKDEPEETLLVTSVFYTLQGEGPYSGLPTVFIRLSKCNLACSFCDAQFDQGERMTFAEIDARIYQVVCEHWNNKGLPVPLWALPQSTSPFVYGVGLVVTGGEPTLQKNLKPFLESVTDKFDWIQIETNGIITQDLDYEVTVVVSPKCAEKDGQPTKYLQPSEEMLKRADFLKFVMCAPAEGNLYCHVDQSASPYETVPEWAHEWRRQTHRSIYVSPMNVYVDVPKRMKVLLNKRDKTLEERSTSDEVVSFWEPGVLDMDANRRNHEYTAQYAITHGFRFQLQAHLYAGLA